MWALFCLHGNLSSTNIPRILWLSHLFQGYEDWLRHKADCSINESPVDVVQQGKVVRTQSHKLRVRMASLAQDSPWGCNSPQHNCSVSPLIFVILLSFNFLSLSSCLFSFFSPFAAPDVGVLVMPSREIAAQICFWHSFKTLRWANLSARFCWGYH